jgi:hypothetical protein
MLDSFVANAGQYIHSSPWLALVAVFVGGILTASNPCVLDLLRRGAGAAIVLVGAYFAYGELQ